MSSATNTRKAKKEANVSLIPLDGRVPPQAKDFEEIVLGAILLERDAFGRVSELLSPSSFYVKANELVFEAITSLAMAQKPTDIYTVTEELNRLGYLDEIGGPSYVSGLTLKVMSSSSLEYHASIVAQKALSRKLIGFASEVLKNAYDDTEEVQQQMQYAEGQLFELSQKKGSQDFVPINPLIKEAFQEIQKAANQKDGVSGLPSGYVAVDEMTSGWQNSDLIIIAARPAMGKTAFVVSMAKNMAIDMNIPVALFNLEMSAVQLVKRVISNVCEIDGQKIKSGRLDQAEWDRLNTNVARLENAPLYINDTPSLSVFELRTKARRLVREHGVKLIIIDYLQLMNASGMSFGNREQEVSTISRSLKMLAKELAIPIIALSQLNRGVENRQGDANSKRPQLADLRESGAIEQDADIVCFIHRPEYYKIYEDNGVDLRGVGEFIIAKHRNGPVGDVRLSFKSEFARFSNLEGIASSGNKIVSKGFGNTSTSNSGDTSSNLNNPVATSSADIDPLGGGFNSNQDIPF